MKATKATDRITAAFSDQKIVGAALTKAVQDALRRHKQMGVPVVVWRDDQIVEIAPEDIQTELEPSRSKD